MRIGKVGLGEVGLRKVRLCAVSWVRPDSSEEMPKNVLNDPGNGFSISISVLIDRKLEQQATVLSMLSVPQSILIFKSKKLKNEFQAQIKKQNKKGEGTPRSLFSNFRAIFSVIFFNFRRLDLNEGA